MNWYEREKRAFGRRQTTARTRTARRRRLTASDIIRIRKGTTLESVFADYISRLVAQVRRERPDLVGLELDLRRTNNLGFRLTRRSEDGSTVEFYVDCTFKLAPEYINVIVTGATGTKNFSNTLRMFLYDPLMKTARRLAGVIPPVY